MNSQIVHSLADIHTFLTAGGATPNISLFGHESLHVERVTLWLQRLLERRLGHGDRLLVLAAPGCETIAVMVAAWSLGIVVCPVPPEMKIPILEKLAADCGAGHAVFPADNTWLGFDRQPLEGAVFLYQSQPKVTGPDLALIIYSSGSTGAPKGIMLSHGNVLSALRSISAYLQLSASDSILVIPPLHFDYGLYQVLFAFFTGCSLVLAPPGTHPMKALQLIKEVQPTVVPVVPALGGGLAQLGIALKQSYSSVRLITNTGGHLSEQVIKSLQIVFPNAKIMPMYGLTESKRALFLPPELVDSRPGSVGKPMPGLEAKLFVINNDTQQRIVFRETLPNEIGTLCVRGASVMQGYTQADNGAGATILHGRYRDDNWLSTGDLFSRDEHGFFYFRGREKELIKQGGYCLYPRDIEAAVEKHVLVSGSAVVGITDHHGDELACLFVLASDGAEKEQLIDWLHQHFDRQYMPRRIELIERWPLNQNGKVDKNALRAML